ncbi:MAG: hypothetical protein WCK82_01215 [Bacteroidota bacterium]
MEKLKKLNKYYHTFKSKNSKNLLRLIPQNSKIYPFKVSEVKDNRINIEIKEEKKFGFFMNNMTRLTLLYTQTIMIYCEGVTKTIKVDGYLPSSISKNFITRRKTITIPLNQSESLKINCSKLIFEHLSDLVESNGEYVPLLEYLEKLEKK